jgi:hypothetical protein
MPRGFLIEPEPIPFALVAQTASLSKPQSATASSASYGQGEAKMMISAFNPVPASRYQEGSNWSTLDSLDWLLERQKKAPLPMLYGGRTEGNEVKGERLRIGISEVLDGGQQVVVLFSAINTSKHAILLMPPQIQLGGKQKSGKLLKHEHWSTAEQLPVVDFRLSCRRIGPGERTDGVVRFDRPPYKQSTETLFLQMVESGAIDKPALAPIGFGVSTLREVNDNHAQ